MSSVNTEETDTIEVLPPPIPRHKEQVEETVADEMRRLIKVCESLDRRLGRMISFLDEIVNILRVIGIGCAAVNLGLLAFLTIMVALR